MGIITIEKADRLYWLGRYAERVYTTIKEFFDGFDRMIDENEESYGDFCRRINIPNIYENKEDFLSSYPFSTQNPDSILSNLYRAYDNAVVMREEIGTETLCYIQMAIYDMKSAKDSTAPLIELQKVIDDILAFWGCFDDCVSDAVERSIGKAGRRLERLDLYLRFEMSAESIRKEAARLGDRIPKTQLEYDEGQLEQIQKLVKLEVIPYREVVQLLECLLDV